jgi:hypothetical protein
VRAGATILAALLSGLALVVVSTAAASPAEKRCKIVIKIVHGKKKRVRVCRTVNPPPPPPPSPAPPAPGGKDSPIPVGTAMRVDDGWNVTIVSSDPNATQAILDSQRGDPDNLPAPPPPGYQFLVARLTVTRTAPEAATFSPYALDLVSSAGTTYSGGALGCGLIPDALEANDLVDGQTATGNVCWVLPAAEIHGVLADYTDPFTGKDTFFTLGL